MLIMDCAVFWTKKVVLDIVHQQLVHLLVSTNFWEANGSLIFLSNDIWSCTLNGN